MLMINGKTLSLVVPCKNEAGIIAGFIRRVPPYVDEIIIVDNNSTDLTGVIAKREGAVVIREHRAVGGIGYGFAHMTGMRQAKGDIIIGMDGDDTYPVDKIDAVVRYMDRKNLDVVSCNRLPLRNPEAISFTRQIGIMLLNLEINFLFGYAIKDILTGMWAVRSDAVEKLALTQGDWNLSVEIKLRALLNRTVRFAEYHIDHFERIGNPSKQQIYKTGIQHALFIGFTWLAIVGKQLITGIRTVYKPFIAWK